jgi:hypothetical protein
MVNQLNMVEWWLMNSLYEVVNMFSANKRKMEGVNMKKKSLSSPVHFIRIHQWETRPLWQSK